MNTKPTEERKMELDAEIAMAKAGVEDTKKQIEWLLRNYPPATSSTTLLINHSKALTTQRELMSRQTHNLNNLRIDRIELHLGIQS